MYAFDGELVVNLWIANAEPNWHIIIIIISKCFSLPRSIILMRVVCTMWTLFFTCRTNEIYLFVLKQYTWHHQSMYKYPAVYYYIPLVTGTRNAVYRTYIIYCIIINHVVVYAIYINDDATIVTEIVVVTLWLSSRGENSKVIKTQKT